MTTTLRLVGRSTKYYVLDRQCIGRPCLVLGHYQHRSGGGSGGGRNTGSPDTPCCMTRQYRGCPHPLPEYDAEIAKERRSEGVRP